MTLTKINNEKNKNSINKYGYLRLEFIKNYKKSLYESLLMKGELTKHLISVSKECEEKLENLMQSFKENDDRLTKKYKEKNQLEWVKHMNNHKNSVEEIILNEIIYK